MSDTDELIRLRLENEALKWQLRDVGLRTYDTLFQEKERYKAALEAVLEIFNQKNGGDFDDDDLGFVCFTIMEALDRK